MSNLTQKDKIKIYLTSPKLVRRIKYLAARFGKMEFWEDIYHSYCVAILEGKSQNQTLDQFFIDHSRKEGWCRKEGKLIAQIVEYADYKMSLEEFTQMELYEIERVSSLLSGYEKTIFKLFFKYDLLQEEIGDCFGVEASRVSQIIKGSIKRIKEIELH